MYYINFPPFFVSSLRRLNSKASTPRVIIKPFWKCSAQIWKTSSFVMILQMILQHFWSWPILSLASVWRAWFFQTTARWAKSLSHLLTWTQIPFYRCWRILGAHAASVHLGPGYLKRNPAWLALTFTAAILESVMWTNLRHLCINSLANAWSPM